MKDVKEAAYNLGIEIYRDSSLGLLELSQSTFLDKILKGFSMRDFKKGFIPMNHGLVLSKSQYPETLDEQGRMSGIPYASAIGSIMLYCT